MMEYVKTDVGVEKLTEANPSFEPGTGERPSSRACSPCDHGLWCFVNNYDGHDHGDHGHDGFLRKI